MCEIFPFLLAQILLYGKGIGKNGRTDLQGLRPPAYFSYLINQFQFFRTRHALNLHFSLLGGPAIWHLLNIDQAYRGALAGIFCAAAGIVGFQPAGDIGCPTGVEGLIDALHHIDKKRQLTHSLEDRDDRFFKAPKPINCCINPRDSTLGDANSGSIKWPF